MLLWLLYFSGVRCEANTFDGERCLYGALTDKIKRLLLSYNMVSSKVIRRDLYEEFLRRYGYFEKQKQQQKTT
jgi:ankyrin repeat/BTB/POZ domain-containing protein 1